MKKRYLFLMLLILILSISAVSASQNVSDFKSNHLEDELLQDEVVEVISENESVDNSNEINIQNSTDSNEQNSTNEPTIINGNNLVQYQKSHPIYKVKITDSKGNPKSNLRTVFEINGKSYYRTTNNNGEASLNINLKAGTYKIKVSCDGETLTNTIKLFASRISKNKDISTTYGSKATYQIKVVDNFGKAMVNKNVKFRVAKKIYNVKTNAKGIAKLKLSYNSGKYSIKYSVNGLTGTNRYVVKNKISLSILNWNNSGDVSKNRLIRQNMPDNIWVKKAVAATNEGITLLRFKGGNGKVVFITAGVHGNEISSQVAAMKLIKHLTKTPIKGTVYIIPFVNIKAITKKVRFTDRDYNRIANRDGTIPNKIVRLVVKYNCDYYGDFHTTKPGGVPGKNVVMGSKTPTFESFKLTNYIVNKTKVNKIMYSYAGQSYPGAIADNVNKKGIPAVLCEVMLPHNTITTKTVNLSLKMMKSLLEYANVI